MSSDAQLKRSWKWAGGLLATVFLGMSVLTPPSFGQAAGAAGVGNGGGGNVGNMGAAGTTTGGTTAGGAATGNNTAGGETAPGEGALSGGRNGDNLGNGNNAQPAPGPLGQTTGTGRTVLGAGPALVPGQTIGGLPQPTGGTGPATYSLAQTIAGALNSSSDLQIAARNVQIDQKRADEAAAAGRPNVRANASATRYDQATKIQIGGGPPVEVQKSHSELLSINVGDQLDITGQVRAASSQARLQSLADQFTLDQIRNGRILRAKSVFYNLLRAEHQVQVADQNLATAQRQLRDAQNLFVGQVGQRIDVYRAATQVATAQQQLTAAQNNQAIARESFNDLVGRPLTAQTQVEDVPGVNVGADVTNTASVGALSALSLFQVPTSEVSGIDVGQSVNTAIARRPEILAGEVNVRVAQTGIKLAHAGLEPTLALNAGGNYFPTTSFQSPRQRTAAITATLSLPLYDGGATRDRVQEAQLRTENARTALESTRSDVTLDVRQSYLNLSTAARQIGAANTALQQAIAARQLAQIRYEGQVGTYLEVTDAQSALVQAENSQVNAVYDYLIARAQFQNAVGTPQTQ